MKAISHKRTTFHLLLL